MSHILFDRLPKSITKKDIQDALDELGYDCTFSVLFDIP